MLNKKLIAPCNIAKAVLFSFVIFSFPLSAADFNVGSSSTETNQQTLLDNETGYIDATGQLTTNNSAIIASGINNSVTNDGTIATTANSAYGLSSSGDNLNLINNGSITTQGDFADGIFTLGDDATIVNNGTITTNSSGASGLFSNGNNAHITNNGTISSFGFGIFSNAGNATVINNGIISTTNANAFGLFSQGSNVTLINSGFINTQGNDAFGIFSTSGNAVITNSGVIETSGTNAFAIFSVGGDAVINNSGLVAAYAPSTPAILAGYNATLNLLPGSQIIGRIDLGDDGGDNDTANIYIENSLSQAISFENTENINIFGSAALVGNTVVTMEQTGESTRSVALSAMTTSIHNVISQRMAQPKELKTVQLASLEVSPSMYFEEHKPVAWLQVFGGNLDRDAEKTMLAYEYDHTGINFGYEWDINQTRIGLIGGYVKANFDTQTTSYSSESDNYYVGAYANKKMNMFSLTGSFLAGYADNTNDRLVLDNINGLVNAESSFDSLFLSPSFTVSSAYRFDDRLELRPSATVAYNIAWLDGYTESGTTNANLKIDDRKIKALTTRFQLAVAYQFTQQSEFEFRLGVNSRHTHDENINVSIASSRFHFASGGDKDVISSFAGTSLRISHDNLSFVADMEFGGNNDEDYVSANISLEYSF